jgi:transposase
MRSEASTEALRLRPDQSDLGQKAPPTPIGTSRCLPQLFDTGHNRKTDAHDAHAVAVVAVRTPGLRVLSHDVELEALRMLVDRRQELTRTRIQTVNRLQRLLSELTPGQAKRDITPLQAKTILASVQPRDMAGKTRRRLAAEQLAELVVVDKKIQTLTKELKALVLASGS